jgi:hypothetical protein
VIIRSVCCEKIARTYVEVVAVVVDVVVVVDSVRVAVLVIVAVEVIVLVGWRYEEQKTLAAAIRVLCVLRVSLVWCFTNRSLLRISQSPEYVVRIAACVRHQHSVFVQDLYVDYLCDDLRRPVFFDRPPS